jgi:hypothetical protein
LKTAAEWICDGRLLVALEGGYDLVALPWCIRRAIEVLLGLPRTPDPLGPRDVPVPSSFEPMLKSVKKLHGLL